MEDTIDSDSESESDDSSIHEHEANHQSAPSVSSVDIVDTPSTDNCSNVEEEVKEAKEIESSSQPETIDVPLENSSDQVLFCPTCDQDYAYYAYLNSLNRPSRHYVLGCCCYNCGKEFQHGPYWGHVQNRAGMMCEMKERKYCLACFDACPPGGSIPPKDKSTIDISK